MAKTMQGLFERAGLDCHRRSGAPPKLSSGQAVIGVVNSRLSRSQRVMQREADERQSARDYQLALVYADSEHKSSPVGWQQRVVVESGQELSSGPRIEAGAKLRQAQKAKVSNLKKRLVESRMVVSKEKHNTSRGYAKARVAALTLELQAALQGE